MMYEAYEKKVRGYVPYAKALKICVKCVILLLILAAVSLLGVLVLRGIHFGDFTLAQDSVAFGDKPKYDCFVLFGTYECEYAEQGRDVWTDEQPTTPGVYRVRAVIRKGFFGKKVYSEEQALTLYRRDVTLRPDAVFASSVPYGDAPVYGKHWEIPSSVLAKGHEVEEAELLRYEYDGHGGMTLYVDAASVVICDRKGNDVTNGYALSGGTGTIKVKARDMTVVVADEIKNGRPVDITKVYDGHAAGTSAYHITAGSLLRGDSISVINTSTATDAGKHNNTARITITSKDGQDRTSYYNIKKDTCKIVIEKRPLQVSTPDVTLEYSGSMQYTDQYSIDRGSLASGQSVSLVRNNKTGVREVTARPAENKVLLQIWYGGKDVTKNYEITYKYGSLTVTPRTLHVRTEDSYGLTYNGQAQSWTDYEIIKGGLGDGHSLSAKNAATLTEPGSCENRVDYEVISSDGKNVTKNYVLKVDFGTLVVATGGASVTFGLQDLSKTYDSRPLDPNDYDVSSLISVLSGGLCANDYVEVTSATGGQTEVGQSTYNVNYRIMHKSASGKTVDATEWYSHRMQSQGYLSVEPCTVTIKFDPITKQYDGKAVWPTSPDLSFLTLSNFEDGGHKVVLADGAMQALQLTKSGTAVSEALNIGSYSYTIPLEYISVVTQNGFADRTSNYRFEFSGNTIKIEGISLSLTAPGATKEYDGTPLSADQFSASDVTVQWGAQGYRVSYSLTGSLTDAGTGSVSFADIVVMDANDRDVTENFDIKTIPGKLTITPIALTVQSSSGSKVYDGLPMDNATQMTLLEGHLVQGHVLGGSVNANYVTDVGTHDNDKVSPKVYSATGADMTRNYRFSLVPGQYTVERAKLHIKAPVVEGEYTGKVYEGTCDATNSAEGLAQGQRVELNVVSDGIKPGRYPMQVTGFCVRNARGADVSSNYSVSLSDLSDCELEIVPRKIVITTGSQTVSYQNAPAINTRITVGRSGLLKGHELRATFRYPDGQREIGTVSNSLLEVKIVDENGVNVTRYYDITYQYGELCVEPIPITLQTGGAYKEVYDGQVISAAWYEVTKGEIQTLHDLIVEFTYADGVADVGTWKNSIESIRVVNRGGKDVSYMYDFTVMEGELIIEKPYRLYMTSESASKVYDGTPLSANAYTVEGNVLEGHSIRSVKPVTLTFVGEAKNRLTLAIADETGRDVSKNYEFYYEEGALGTLTVLPRPISIKIGYVEPIYNGTMMLSVPQSQLDYSGLVPGENISLTVEVNAPEIGDKPEAVCNAPRIYNANGIDVTDCYTVSFDDGEFSVCVMPAPLTLYLPARYGKEYDTRGLDVNAVGYRALGLASGHEVVYLATSAPAEPGSYTLEFTDYAVYDKDGNDVSQNYLITASTCAVTINKKYIRLQSEDAARHYNGEELVCHRLKKYTITGGFVPDVTFTGSQTQVGTSKNKFEVVVYDANGNDVTEYCYVDRYFGDLTVWGNIPVTFTSDDACKIYDGTALRCDTILAYTLPEGYVPQFSFTGEQTAPGESDNTFDVVIIGPDGEVANDAFDITKEYGKLRVYEKAEDYVLTLRSKSATKSYDGRPLTCRELEPYQLPDGFELEVSFTGSQTALGSSQNTFTARAYNESGDELTVVCEYGELKVELNVTINVYEMTFTYDGTMKNCGEGDFWTQGLPADFEVRVTFGEGLVVTGSKDVEIESVVILDGNGQDVTHLCNWTVKTAKLTVLPRTLTVYVYGQSADSIAPVQGRLVDGHVMFAEYGNNGECFIEIATKDGTLVYSNRGDSPIRHVLYDVIIQYG